MRKTTVSRLLPALALATAAAPVLPPVMGGATPAMAQAAQNPCSPGTTQQSNGNKSNNNGNGSGKSTKPAGNPCAPS